MKRIYLDYLNDILDAITDIEDFTNNLSYDEFAKDNLRKNAVVRSLEVIGEAAKNIPDSARNKYADIPWKRMSGMRDKLIHGYFGIDYESVWAVATERLLELKPSILKMIEEAGKDSNA